MATRVGAATDPPRVEVHGELYLMISRLLIIINRIDTLLAYIVPLYQHRVTYYSMSTRVSQQVKRSGIILQRACASASKAWNYKNECLYCYNATVQVAIVSYQSFLSTVRRDDTRLRVLSLLLVVHVRRVLGETVASYCFMWTTEKIYSLS